MLCKVIVIGKVVYSLVLFIGDNVIDILFEFYNLFKEKYLEFK